VSALSLALDPDPGRRADDACRLTASLERQGLPLGFTRSWPGITLGWHATPGQPDSRTQWLERPDGGMIACVGTLFHRGRSGPQALAALWDDFIDGASAASPALAGEYQVVLARHGRVWLFGDPLGMVKRYESSDGRVVSTSWLACADAQARLDPDPVGALDYVFHGANHGLRTACAQVRIGDPAEVRELVRGVRETHFGAPFWQPGPLFRDRDEAIARILARLRDLATGWAEGFPGRVRSALSGGFDSRLLLAVARATGQQPALHVYGRPDSADVRTARALDRALGLGLRVIDKASLDHAQGPRPQGAAHEALLDANLDFFDGLPIDGIGDHGADRITRIAQSADGALALNGGGGEVLRNFFHVGDRRLRARDLVRIFWGGVDIAALRDRSLADALEAHLVATIARELGHDGILDRQQVELVYPLLRGRYWTSRNNTMAARCGHFLTPLLDPAIVRDAVRLPLAWKAFGRFEGTLIARLDRELGSLPLADGFAPASGPGALARLWALAEDLRPPWLRATVARLRVQRSGGGGSAGDDAGGDDSCFERTRELIDPQRLRAPAPRARLLTLERVLARHPRR